MQYAVIHYRSRLQRRFCGSDGPVIMKNQKDQGRREEQIFASALQVCLIQCASQCISCSPANNPKILWDWTAYGHDGPLMLQWYRLAQHRCNQAIRAF